MKIWAWVVETSAKDKLRFPRFQEAWEWANGQNNSFSIRMVGIDHELLTPQHDHVLGDVSRCPKCNPKDDALTALRKVRELIRLAGADKEEIRRHPLIETALITASKAVSEAV